MRENRGQTPFLKSWSVRGFLLACVLLATVAYAQPYPARPVRVIVTFPPGAGSDITTRIVTTKLAETFGRPFVIDNRAGAAGNIGVDLAAHAAPDGYTLLAMTASAAISQSAYSKISFDLTRDFAPIAMMASAPFVLAVNTAIPAKTLKDIVDLAKAKPGGYSYATPGTGSSPHMAGELLKMELGIDLLHVPYKGTVPAVADVMAGNVSMTIANTLVVLPQLKAGRVRGIAITSARRSAIVPELPTISEAGVRGFESGTWYGLAAPIGTSRPVIDRLNRETRRVVDLPDVREKLAAQGAEPMITSPEQMGEFVRREIARWAKVVKAAGIRLD